MGTRSAVIIRDATGFVVWEKTMDGFLLIGATMSWLSAGPASGKLGPDPEGIGTSNTTWHVLLKDPAPADWIDIWDDPRMQEGAECCWEYLLCVDWVDKVITLPPGVGSLRDLMKRIRPWLADGWDFVFS